MSSAADTGDYVAGTPLPGWTRPRLFSARVHVDVSGWSDAGKVRPNNEDHFYVARYGRFLETVATNVPELSKPSRLEEIGYGATVADGMGGHAAGEVASKLAITTFLNLVLGTPDWILRLDDDLLPHEIKRRAMERFGQVQTVMAEHAQADPRLEGLGTTLTLAISLGKELFLAHLGDSRAYLLRQRKLYQLTKDHTLAQELVDRGALTPQQGASSRLRHVLTKSLGGSGEHITPDVQELLLEDGDCLLLCTDGLTDMVAEQQIAAILDSAATAEKACHELIDQALAGGGKDNVTAVVARYTIPFNL
jgi:protein phosphatase